MEKVPSYWKITVKWSVKIKWNQKIKFHCWHGKLTILNVNIPHFNLPHALPYKLNWAALQPGKMIFMSFLSTHNWPNTQTSKQTFERGIPPSLDLNLCSFHISRIWSVWSVRLSMHKTTPHIHSLMNMKFITVTVFSNPPWPCPATGRIIQTLPSLHQHYQLIPAALWTVVSTPSCGRLPVAPPSDQ